MPTLQELKAKSQANLNKFKEKSKEPVYEKKVDDTTWYPKRDEQGNGFAVIRFLPVPPQDESDEKALPWVKIYSHSFKNEATNKWYIENSLTTFNEKDPVGELNSILWKRDEAGKAQASAQKRKLSYTSNIYVVRDPASPENEGKVFKYSYGKKIYDKILALMNPDETYGEDPVDPFNLWTGRNFRMKIKSVKSGENSYPNYDSSEWDSAGPISDKTGRPLTDEEMEHVYNSEYSLLELIDREKHFKSYEELDRKLKEVLGSAPSSASESVNTEQRKKKEEKKVVVDEDDDDDEITKLIDDVKSSGSDDTDDLIDQWINDD